ncbi:MAG: Cyclohexanecarboxylate-CoA ligase, partial [Actinomycetia bacterium]|nr:Cyclohexanecarboxylate-CoA ligase [Actinomycetes bacterium]
MTFWELVAAAAADHPERVVVADDHGRSLTSRQLHDAAE